MENNIEEVGKVKEENDNKVLSEKEPTMGASVAEVIDSYDLDDSVKERLKEEISVTVSETIVQQFRGPIPPPEMMAGYHEIDPSIVDKIFDLTKKEQDSIIKLKNEDSSRQDFMLKSASRDNLLGAIFAFMVILIMILIGPYLITKGYELPGYMLSGTGILSVIKLFIFPTNFTKNDKDSN